MAMSANWTKVLPSFVRLRLEGSPNLQRILANVGWLFGDRLLRLGIGLLVGVWVARYLGPEQYGTLNYAIAFVALFVPLANLGLDSIVVRNIVQDPSCRDETLGSAFVMRLIGSVGVLILTGVAISVVRPDDALIRSIVAILAFSTLFQSFDTIDLWFQSQVKSKYTVVAKNIAFLIATAARVILITSNASLIMFVLVSFFEIVMGSVGLLLVYRRSGQRLKAWKPRRARAVILLRDSWPLILSSLAVMTYMRIDQIMLGGLANDREVGIYSAAVRLSELWYFIPTVVVSSTFPAIVAAKRVDEAVYIARTQNLFNLMTAMALSIAIPMTFISTPLVKILFGQAYAEAGPVLAVHIWAGVAVFLGVARESWMTTEGLMKLSFLTTLVGAITNVVLNILLIPRFGAMGAAIATVIAYAVAVVVMCFFFRQTRPVARMMLKAFTFRK